MIVTGRDPVSAASVRVALDPNQIGSRVTDYTALGNN